MMETEHGATEGMELLVRQLQRIEDLTADECERYAGELMEALRAGTLNREVYEALEDVLDRQYAVKRGLTTIL